MPTLQLSDVTTGTVQFPRRWSNQSQKYIERDPFQHFIEDLGKTSPGLVFQESNLKGGSAYHRNYIAYLQKCWGEHLGIVITPDILWYTLLCELAALVKSDPERYRHLFSESQERQEITIATMELIVMPLSVLIEALKDRVPTDTELFLPEFTTTSLRSQHAFRAAFCDMCSPYYDYSMMACGFPAIDVRGAADDYIRMRRNWDRIGQLFNPNADTFDPAGEWFARVGGVLHDCVARLTDADWWREMFRLDKCGSGSDVVVRGWLTQLFQEQPRLAMPRNFPSGVSIVDYKQLDTGKQYRMLDGLFLSKVEGDFLVPQFGFAVFERAAVA